jgi:hypothetical protein
MTIAMLILKRCRHITALIVILVASTLPAHADDPAGDFARIHEGMSKLAPMVGKCRATAIFHDGDKLTENDGTYDVEWALEDTYIECHVELHREDDPSHHHSFVIYITYNPASQHYDSTYFYSRWARRVTESGDYDAAKQEFKTQAYIPLEDGVRNENVHTVTHLQDPNKIVYTHYSRYDNESAECMNVEITLTREK